MLLGPSGAGKTTTLRLISGLERPDNGSIAINGRDVTRDPPGTRDIAFVFQQYSLYPHLTVYDNLAFPLRSPARRIPEATIRKRVEQTAELLHISSKLGNRATRLSGGEMQRVAIGRALVRDPAIYLMDEPLSSLDAKLRAELRLELKRIQVELGATILYVTHDQVEAMTMASRIGVIRNGALLQLGTPREIYENPSDRYVASRLGTPQINFLPATRHSRVRGAGRDRDHRHPHRAPADQGEKRRRHRRPGAPHRAPRRSEPRLPRIPGRDAGDAGRSASAARPPARTSSSSLSTHSTSMRLDGASPRRFIESDPDVTTARDLQVTGQSGRGAGDC